MAVTFITGNLKDCLTDCLTHNHSITPNVDYCGTKTRAEFNGICL